MNQIANEAVAGAGDLNLFGEAPCWTPEIEQLSIKVAHWIRCDLPGASVYGVQRIGKSFCAEYLRRVVPDLLGGTTIAFTWNIEIAKVKGELETIRDWLAQSGSLAFNHSRIGILKARLYEQLVSSADAVRANRIFLIIDEAHRFEREHFQILMILFNGIQQRGKKCFVLLVGEPKLKEMRSKFDTVDSLQIVGRFFSVEHRFSGIEPQRLDELLDAIDDARQIVRRCLAAHAARGFRLADLAPLYVCALEQMRTDLGLVGDVRLPMQYLRSSLNNVIYELVENPETAKIDTDLIRRALQVHGFDGVMKYFM